MHIRQIETICAHVCLIKDVKFGEKRQRKNHEYNLIARYIRLYPNKQTARQKKTDCMFAVIVTDLGISLTAC